MRVWFLKETPSIDVNCGTGCNIVIHTRGNTIHRITPRQNNEVNSAWMPDSHRLNFHYIDGDARLTEPLTAVIPGQQHEGTDWSAALLEASARLKTFSQDQIAIIGSGRMTNEELMMLKKLQATFGAPQLSLVPRTGEADELLIAADRNPNTTGAKLILETEDPYASLGEILEGVRSGRVKALLVFGEDLVSDAGFTTEDLSRLDFLLQCHLLANPTANHAHLVLPGAAFAEKRGSMVNLSGRLQRLNRAIEPPLHARDDWEMIRDLIAAYTGEMVGIHLIEDLFKEIATTIPAFQGLTLSKIGHLGTVITETPYEIPLLKNERARKAAGTING